MEFLPSGGCVGAKLLARSAYLVVPRFLRALRIDAYSVLDPATRETLGVAAELTPPLAHRLFRSAFGRNLLRTGVQAYDFGTGERVFSLRELPSLWRPRLLLLDGEDRPLCYFKGFFATMLGGFMVRHPSGGVLGRLFSESLDGQYSFQNAVAERIGAIRESAPSLKTSVPEYLVTLSEPTEYAGVASVLLLGATLALDLVYRERVGRELEPAKSLDQVQSNA